MRGILDEMPPLGRSLTEPFRTDLCQRSKSLNPARMRRKTRVSAGDTHVCWVERPTAFTTEYHELGLPPVLVLHPTGNLSRLPARGNDQVGPRRGEHSRTVSLQTHQRWAVLP